MIDYIAQQIGQMELYLLTAAAIISFLGLFTSYRLVSAILFVEFLVMTGYQSVILAPDNTLRMGFENGLMWMPDKYIWALFLTIKVIIQTILLLTYHEIEENIKLKNYKIQPLMAMSGLIILYMSFEMFITLLGFNATSYEVVMTVISVTQLVIGLSGVIRGSRFNLNIIRRNNRHSGHKRT